MIAAPTPAPPVVIGRLAVRALHAELALWPKPGLVSPGSPGSHGDMDAGRMWRGIWSLRRVFGELARAAAHGETFHQLQARGRRAEVGLLAATGGVNTHRGALFHLGLLAAAAGAGARGEGLGRWVRARCAADLSRDAAASPGVEPTHGQTARAIYGTPGARGEAAAGYPSLWSVALPALASTRARGSSETEAKAQALFALIAHVEDTNLLHRGGPAGLKFARAAARAWLVAGGVFTPDWRERALVVHRAFVARRLSPGGSADLLAATIFVDALGRTELATEGLKP